MRTSIGFQFVILLNAAGLLSCSDRASGSIDGSPECRLDGSNEPCCVDDRVCERLDQSGFHGPAVAVSLEALCGVGPCETDLETALASPACSFVRIGCGVTEVDRLLSGHTFTTIYDSETGKLVGARSIANEGVISTVDGCCGAEFRAGVELPFCPGVPDVACAERP